MATKAEGTPLGTPEVGAGLESSKKPGFAERRVLGASGRRSGSSEGTQSSVEPCKGFGCDRAKEAMQLTLAEEGPALTSLWLQRRAWPLAWARAGAARITVAVLLEVLVLGAREQCGAVVCC